MSDARTALPTLRLPNAPYPGLRPFLDHEDMLMHGRAHQVAEVVDRLGRQRQPVVDAGQPVDEADDLTRFVAVIGGSGSGKSSLIRAGVVPYLRQFGIPEAGDLWEAVVATPGTNFQPDADGRITESPITRLARKIERVLRGGHQPERCEAIAQTLRRPGGLGLAVDLYGPELDLPPGVRPETACVLIVIDQFEELFHKTNAGTDDARQLLERVIDHYHQAKHGKGSARCFLAITMRSEHLNDCAGCIGLPEAINAGAFLVSRLDDSQVREVIEKPAQRYLRLRQREQQAQQRQQPAGSAALALPMLPRSVLIEPAVVERLVQDTQRIAHDPDHLPLLQHALARTWATACEREGLAQRVGDGVGASPLSAHSGVPQRITVADLWRAAQANSSQAPDADANVLRLSLDAWAEAAFHSHPEAEQAQVLALLRRLAYKDSRSGTYNQQRIYAAHHPLGQAALHALVRGRWIDNVDYLHWDDEDPQRVTLKVSHESFIRGWHRLRALADQEALRLEQFLALLTTCRDWVDKGRRDEDLLDLRLLRRMEDANIEAALGALAPQHDGEPATALWQDWQRWLGQTPQGQSLQAVLPADARRFYRRSRRMQDYAQHKDQRKTRTIAALAALVVFSLLGTGFAYFVQQPVADRSRLFFDAANQANQATLRNAYAEIGGSQLELYTLLYAASQLEKARTPGETRFARISDAVLQGDWSPLRDLRLAHLLPEAARTVEPSVNGKLRAVLQRSVWRTANALPADAQQQIDGSASAPLLNVNCDGLGGMLKPAEGSREGDDPRRGIFVSKGALLSGIGAADTRNNLMYTASVQADGRCTLGKQLMALPRDRDPAVMFDATLSHLLLAVDGDMPGAPATVSISRVRWDDPAAGDSAEIYPPLAVVFNDKTAETLRQQVPLSVGMAAATWRMPGGRAIRVGSEAWRVVADSAQRLVPQPTEADLLPLQPAAGDAGCQAIAHALDAEFSAGQTRPAQAASTMAPVRSQVLPHGGYCLAILRMALPPEPGAPAAPARDQVNARAYARPGAQELDTLQRLTVPAVAVASFEFGRVSAADDRWYTGRPDGNFDGWLILQRSASARLPVRWQGTPWSTNALLQLGAQVLQQHKAVLALEVSAKPLAAARPAAAVPSSNAAATATAPTAAPARRSGG